MTALDDLIAAVERHITFRDEWSAHIKSLPKGVEWATVQPLAQQWIARDHELHAELVAAIAAARTAPPIAPGDREREDELSRIESLLTKASECLSRVCADQRFKLTACVPARPGVDDDLVLRDGIEAGLEAVALMRAASAAPAAARASTPAPSAERAAAIEAWCQRAMSEEVPVYTGNLNHAGLFVLVDDEIDEAVALMRAPVAAPQEPPSDESSFPHVAGEEPARPETAGAHVAGKTDAGPCKSAGGDLSCDAEIESAIEDLIDAVRSDATARLYRDNRQHYIDAARTRLLALIARKVTAAEADAKVRAELERWHQNLAKHSTDAHSAPGRGLIAVTARIMRGERWEGAK